MKSEALRNIRTLREAKISLDVAGGRKFKTANSLSKTTAEVERLESLTDPRLLQILEKEKRRVAAYEASVNKSRQRMLRGREKLAMTVNRNRALTELRHELQRARWSGDSPAGSKAEMPAPERNQSQVELRY